MVRRLRPGIVHANDPHGLAQAAVAARLAGPRLPGGRPAVVAHRRVDFPIRRHPFSRWKHARGPDRVIAVSRHVRDVLAAGGVPRERIAVVPDGVEPAPCPPSAALRRTVRERLGVPVGAPLVVTLAAFVPRKDPATLVAAAGRVLARNPAARWVVMGEGPLLDTVRAELGRRGLAERLRCPGFAPDAARLLPGADAFVLVSRREALGVAVLEAMAAGLPVIATRVGGILEAVEEGRSGLLVPPGDADALAAAVERVLGHPELARRLGAAARARAREFSAARMIDGVERVNRDAPGRRRSGASFVPGKAPDGDSRNPREGDREWNAPRPPAWRS